MHLRHSLFLWASLNILRVESGEKIFRQMKQNSARVVYPTRRDFVKYHEKDSVDSRHEEFLEMPLYDYFTTILMILLGTTISLTTVLPSMRAKSFSSARTAARAVSLSAFMGRVTLPLTLPLI